jgi:deferrochelatase/peroxidase EfeB
LDEPEMDARGQAFQAADPIDRFSRRSMLGLLGTAALGGILPEANVVAAPSDADRSAVVTFHGRHQAGIVTPPPPHMLFAAFDVTTDRSSDVRDLMRTWTDAAVAMTRGRSSSGPTRKGDKGPVETGETLGLPAASLTLTFGLGSTLFDRDGHDRFGLRAMRPPALRDLPAFAHDRLDSARSGGDLCVQACAEDSLVVFHAIHELARLGLGVVRIRWLQQGFGQTAAVGGEQPTPRNLMGFKDGTLNIRNDDRHALNRFVWVRSPSWMRGGSYVVVRRIRMRLEEWDTSSLADQQHTIGRMKESGAPLGMNEEFDRLDLSAHRSNGRPVIPQKAHVRLASPSSNGGERILRRGYSFADGADGGGYLEAGLFFVAFQRDPLRQFARINANLARNDALNEYVVHTSSAVFAVPSGVPVGGYVAQGLL